MTTFDEIFAGTLVFIIAIVYLVYTYYVCIRDTEEWHEFANCVEKNITKLGVKKMSKEKLTAEDCKKITRERVEELRVDIANDLLSSMVRQFMEQGIELDYEMIENMLDFCYEIYDLETEKLLKNIEQGE